MLNANLGADVSGSPFGCQPSHEPALLVEGVSRRFGDWAALEDVTFAVPAGSVVGLLGANGAGKSTLMRVVLGHLHPDRGRALIGGRPLAAYPVPLRQVGAMTESVGLDPALSARRLLRVLSAGAAIEGSRVEEVLALTEANAYADRPIRHLSTGMRQRVALSLALLGEPALLLLDEPVNGMDPDGIRWFRGFVRELAASGRSVLLSSHLLDEVEQSVDRLVLLRQRVLFDGTLDELPFPYDVEQSYFALTHGERAVLGGVAR